MRPPLPWIIGGLAVLGLAVYVMRKGGAAPAGAALGAAAVDLAGGAASGAVGAVGAAVGLPTPADTVTDAREARYLIDTVGWFTASQWSGAPALFSASRLPVGSGTPPAPSSPAGRMLAAQQGRPVLPVESQPWRPGTSVDDLLQPTPDPFYGA